MFAIHVAVFPFDRKRALVAGIIQGSDDALEVDVTFFQMLFAAHREAEKTGKSVTLSLDYPPVVRKALLQAGLCKHAGLCKGSTEPCLWSGEGTP